MKDEPLRYEGIAAEASELGLPDRPAAGKTNFVRPEEQERTAKRMGFVFPVIRTARNSYLAIPKSQLTMNASENLRW